ncbi:hypothetical protein GOODEAATRI_014026 [Goodea atripinnis]|uniref:Uncharacterized protein n=1 Tax=Goodea atripinnis TaxID=208336 RepID=A0ABV0P420_9TELE
MKNDMNRKRALISDTFKVKKKRHGTETFGAVDEGGGPADMKSTLEYLMTLFPRKLFNDTLPPIVLKHQLYSIHDDKTLVDKEVNKLQESGELLMFQLGFDSEAFGLVFASDYKTKVLAGEEGKVTRTTVDKFLEKVVSSCPDLSFSKDKMLKEFLFTDSEITILRDQHFVCFLATKAAGEVRGSDCEGCRQLVAFHSQLWQIHKVFYSRP